MYKPKSNLLKELYLRGYIHQCTNIEKLDYIAQKKKIVCYIGFDCTAESLHVGSLIQLMLIRIIQKTGNQPIVLLGSGTSKVGDPSGKDKARQLLEDHELQKNSISIKKNIEKLSINDSRFPKIKFIDNSLWLNDINYINWLRKYGKFFSVNKMLTMDSVNERLKRKQPLSFLEFNYMVLQAYDFLQLNKRENCLVQFGGSDQWGNIISGVDLIRRINKKETFGLTTPLITTSSGEKMGKTNKGSIWLDESLLSSDGYWQFWRNVDDKDVIKFLKLFTELNIEKIKKLNILYTYSTDKPQKNELFILIINWAINNDIDLVCLMSVNPGFGGQSFIENTYNKVTQLKALIERKGASTKIEIDGGVTNKNAKQLVDAGADVLVAGSYVFKSSDQPKTIKDLRILANS